MNGLPPAKDQKEGHRGKLGATGLLLCIFLRIAFSMIRETIQFSRTTRLLKSLQPHSIREFNISPWTTVGGYSALSFSPQDAIVKDFVRALGDLRAYRGSPKGTMSRAHEWFVEMVTTDGRIIQMGCHLPAGKKNVVHGKFVHILNGKFQSEALFQWYQQYSQRWLGEHEKRQETSVERSEYNPNPNGVLFPHAWRFRKEGLSDRFCPRFLTFEGCISRVRVAAARDARRAQEEKQPHHTALRALRRAQLGKFWQYRLDRTGVYRYPHMKYGDNIPQEKWERESLTSPQ